MESSESKAIFGNNGIWPAKAIKAKVCGITTLMDLKLAVAAGADAVGFLIHRSEQEGSSTVSGHRLTRARARELVAAVPANVVSVLLIHVFSGDAIAMLCQEIIPNAIQIQTEVPDFELIAVKKRFTELTFIKTIHIYPDSSVDEVADAVERYLSTGVIDAINLDSRSSRTSGPTGGTGLIHDWRISEAIVKRVKTAPVILAGGLNPFNVRSAVKTVCPYAVDVMTGVEDESGAKSKEKLDSFFTALHGPNIET